MSDVNKYKDAAWDACVTSIGLVAEDMLDTSCVRRSNYGIYD